MAQSRNYHDRGQQANGRFQQRDFQNPPQAFNNQSHNQPALVRTSPSVNPVNGTGAPANAPQQIPSSLTDKQEKVNQRFGPTGPPPQGTFPLKFGPANKDLNQRNVPLDQRNLQPSFRRAQPATGQHVVPRSTVAPGGNTVTGNSFAESDKGPSLAENRNPHAPASSQGVQQRGQSGVSVRGHVLIPWELAEWACTKEAAQAISATCQEAGAVLISVLPGSKGQKQGAIAVEASSPEVVGRAALLIEAKLKLEVDLLKQASEKELLKKQLAELQAEIQSGLRAEFTVPLECLHFVVGDEGSHIKQVQDECHIDKVIVDRNTGTLRIMGKQKEDVARARKLLEYSVEEVQVDSALMGAVVGEQNSTLARIRERTGVTLIQVDRQRGLIRFLGPKGAAAEAAKAALLIRTEAEYTLRMAQEAKEVAHLRNQVQQLDLAWGGNNSASATPPPVPPLLRPPLVHPGPPLLPGTRVLVTPVNPKPKAPAPLQAQARSPEVARAHLAAPAEDARGRRGRGRRWGDMAEEKGTPSPPPKHMGGGAAPFLLPTPVNGRSTRSAESNWKWGPCQVATEQPKMVTEAKKVLENSPLLPQPARGQNEVQKWGQKRQPASGNVKKRSEEQKPSSEQQEGTQTGAEFAQQKPPGKGTQESVRQVPGGEETGGPAPVIAQQRGRSQSRKGGRWGRSKSGTRAKAPGEGDSAAGRGGHMTERNNAPSYKQQGGFRKYSHPESRKTTHAVWQVRTVPQASEQARHGPEQGSTNSS